MPLSTHANEISGIEPLLGSRNLDCAFIEITTKCNLRCVYCGNPTIAHKSNEMNEQDIAAAIRIILEQKVKKVQINGFGETTTVKNWWKYCQPLINAGVELRLTTNGALLFDDASITTLAKFHIITFSIDTVDPGLYARLRPGGNLQNIFDNMSKIRTVAESLNLPFPLYGWSCVLTDKNIFTIAEFVDEGIRRNVKQFTFCNLTKVKKPDNVFQVNHVATMDLDEISRAYQLMQETEQKLKDRGVFYFIEDGYYATLEQAMTSEASQSKEKTGRFSSQVRENMTRNCLDPWNFSFIRANNDVCICCWQPAVGNLKNDSYQDIVNNESAREIRRGLLTGDMHYNCANCQARGLIARKELIEKVENLDPETVLKKMLRFARNAKAENKKVIIWGAG